MKLPPLNNRLSILKRDRIRIEGCAFEWTSFNVPGFLQHLTVCSFFRRWISCSIVHPLLNTHRYNSTNRSPNCLCWLSHCIFRIIACVSCERSSMGRLQFNLVVSSCGSVTNNFSHHVSLILSTRNKFCPNRDLSLGNIISAFVAHEGLPTDQLNLYQW